MKAFSAFASNFELHPKNGKAFNCLEPLFRQLGRLEFQLSVADPSKNQGQLASDFDMKLQTGLSALGAGPCPFQMPSEIPQKLDFVFKYTDRIVTVEVEKANREKILRDILKCHMYLHAGADFAVVALTRNYPHKIALWDLFDFGVQRYKECADYGFGKPELFERILLLGFTQYDSATGQPLSTKTRHRMRQEALLEPGSEAPETEREK